jgi:hypothetical protein
LKSTAESCPACGGTELAGSTKDYARCRSCGHETLVAAPATAAIVNDRLDRDDAGRPNALDRFKSSVLRAAARSHRLLVDVGCASGRFLRQNAGAFERAVGVEVTPECVRYARSLGLHVETDLEGLREAPSVVTFWHSLEHLPSGTIAAMLGLIRERSTPETALIVSVPNADSFQYLLLRERFAFYDAPHHVHQFTPRSLDRLLERHGFERVGGCGSLTYAAFGWLQGALNLFNSRHDYLYYRRKRGWDFGLSPLRRGALDMYNAVLSLVFLLPCGALALADLLLPQRGGVVTSWYRPKTR